MSTYTIKTANLQAVSLFAASDKNETRWYLKGVFYTNVIETRLVASNGACLAYSVEETEGGDVEVIIPMETVKAALQLIGKAPTIDLAIVDNVWSLGGIAFKPLDGKYPNIARVFPTEIDDKPCWIDPENAMLIHKAGKVQGIKKPSYSARVWFDSGRMLFEIGDIKGIIMAIRDGVSTDNHPKF